jgi:hypothetical protein
MSDDPRQVLGPYPESGRAGHKAYWHAAESVLAARRLTGLDAPVVAATAEARARVQVATDIYRVLPADERASIGTEMAVKLGPLWFGDRTEPDADAASQPVHAATLASILIERGEMSLASQPARFRAVADEPVEATSAKRGTTRELRPVRRPASSRHQAPACLQEPTRSPVPPDQPGPGHRL